MSPQSILTKAQLRRTALKERSLYNAHQRQTANKSIAQKVIALIRTIKPRTLNTYLSIDTEVDTGPIVSYCLDNHISLSAPRISGPNLTLHTITGPNDLTQGIWKIREPKTHLPQIDPMKVDIFIVPGLMFDAAGYRLGYGKGYYDRLLKNTPGEKIGIINTNQFVYELPKSHYDIPVNCIVSDTISIKI